MEQTFSVEIEGEADGASRAVGPGRRIADQPQHAAAGAMRMWLRKPIDSTLSPPGPKEPPNSSSSGYWWMRKRCVNSVSGVNSNSGQTHILARFGRRRE